MFKSLSLRRSSISAVTTAVAIFVVAFAIIEGSAHQAIASFLSG